MTAPGKPTRKGAYAVTWFSPKTIEVLREGIARTQAGGIYAEKFHANWLDTALDAIEHLKRRPKRKKVTR